MESKKDRMKGHILVSLDTFFCHLLFEVNDNCRVVEDFDRVGIKIFFLALRFIEGHILASSNCPCMDAARISLQRYIRFLSSSLCS